MPGEPEFSGWAGVCQRSRVFRVSRGFRGVRGSCSLDGRFCFSRCAASSLSCSVFPASLPLYLFLPFWGLFRVCCTVSPAPPLRIVSPAPLPFCLGTFPSVLLCSLRAFSAPLPSFLGTFPFRAFLFSSGRGVLLPAARLLGALSVCGCERKEAFSSARKQAEACRYLPPPRRADCYLRRRVANASPSHVGGHKKRANLAVRSALRFEGRPGISNPATWKPHRKSSGRWHGEVPALRRSRYPSWSSRRP